MALTAEQEQLVIDHQKLAAWLWSKEIRRAPRLWHDDLYSAALEGLMDAAVKFDPAYGFKFSTYATWRIRGQIGDEKRRLYCGRDGQKNRSVTEVSLESFIGARSDNPLDSGMLECLADYNADPGHACDDDQALEMIWSAIATLDGPDRQVAYWHYRNGVTLTEIGRRLGVSESRICQRVAWIKTRVRYIVEDQLGQAS